MVYTNKEFELDSNQLAYHQIADQVRTKIALGDLQPNDRLPAIRNVAKQMGLNPGTVARAYSILERDGVIVTRHGKGSFVAERVDTTIGQQREKLNAIIEKSIVEALGLGFTLADIETSFAVRTAAWREQKTGHQNKSSRTKPSIIRFQGSHDLAVELLGQQVSSQNSGISFNMSFIGSLAGIVALERGEADIAGAHLVDELSGEYNISYVKKIMPDESVLLITLVHRLQGLIVKKGNPRQIIDVRDLIRPDISFVNRQKGSGTRYLLDSQLRKFAINPQKINGYDRIENTHVGVSAFVAQNKADVGLGAQSAAAAAGLDFIPLIKERYDLIMMQEKAKKFPLSLIPDIVKSERFRSMLKSIPGYDTVDTGHTIKIE